MNCVADVNVRVDLLENIPQIANFCHDNAKLFATAAESPISSFMLPYVLKHIKENHSQVKPN
jgi:hypothetical protein